MKFQKCTKDGHEYRIYASEDTERGHIHGAIKSTITGKWVSFAWFNNGRVSNYTETARDLIPEKKRRFKTNEELIASNYSDISFSCCGVVNVKHMGHHLTKTRSDVPEGNYPEKWLDVFTVEE